MMSIRFPVRAAACFFAALAAAFLGSPVGAQALPRPATPASADAFGPGEQAVPIGAAALLPTNGSGSYFFSASYLYTSGGVSDFVAPLTLPAGAEITRICLYAHDDDPAPTSLRC